MESQVCEQRRVVPASVQVYAGHLPQVSNWGNRCAGGGGRIQVKVPPSLDETLLTIFSVHAQQQLTVIFVGCQFCYFCD